MKKGIFLGLLLLITLLALLLAGYIFSIKTDRPARDIEPDSVLHNQEYKDKAAQAEQWLKLLYQQNLLPSVSVAVGIRGNLVWEVPLDSRMSVAALWQIKARNTELAASQSL